MHFLSRSHTILPFGEHSPFRYYINLIELIFRAGYRANLNDSLAYRDSWLHNYLGSFAESSSLYASPYCLENKAKQVLDYYFFTSLHNPDTLVNLCKYKMRARLCKPIGRAIQLLDIPQHLKSLLNLNSVEHF